MKKPQMKLCCAWCLLVYKPKYPNLKVDPNFVFCSKGCRDSNRLFEQLIELSHNVYVEKRIPKLEQYIIGDSNEDVQK